MSNVCFVDTETTGLDIDRHQIWEVGLIIPGENGEPDRQRLWFLPVDLSVADPIALNIGRFRERHPSATGSTSSYVARPEAFASQFARYTWGKHLAGAVVSFDAERLARLLRANGQCPGWHYHLIDVEALAVGYLAGMDEHLRPNIRPPWKSDQLTEALGIKVPEEDKHTALGDARWAKAIYDVVMGS